MGKLEENKKRKKQLLLDSSFDLFMKKGWLETTISDIVKQANVAKGTFYLYYKDKYDIRNNLISYKANQLLLNAHEDLIKNHSEITDLKDQIVHIMKYIVLSLRDNHSLLKFIAKNLSWGVFKSALNTVSEDSDGLIFWDLFWKMIPEQSISENEAEIMIFQIIELIGSTAYNVILFDEPVTLDEYMPYLERSVRLIMDSYIKDLDNTPVNSTPVFLD